MLPDTETQQLVLLPTPRQLEVLRLVASGFTQRQIAVALGISVSGVRRRLQHARHRMNMRPIEIITYLVEMGVIKHTGAHGAPGDTNAT